MPVTEAFTVTMNLLTNLLQIWQDERAYHYLRKQTKLLKKRSDELAKEVYTNDPTNQVDMSHIDHIDRELWLLTRFIIRETTQVEGSDATNRSQGAKPDLPASGGKV